VFKYTTIDIPIGVDVTFSNHPSGAPVVWLASGDVTIEGTVNLDGADGEPVAQSFSFAEPDPGGFAGGQAGGNCASLHPSGGFGPGGGNAVCSTSGSSGSYFYGNPSILPLIA